MQKYIEEGKNGQKYNYNNLDRDWKRQLSFSQKRSILSANHIGSYCDALAKALYLVFHSNITKEVIFQIYQ